MIATETLENAIGARIARLRLLVAEEQPLSAEERAERAYEYMAFCGCRCCTVNLADLTAEDDDGR